MAPRPEDSGVVSLCLTPNSSQESNASRIDRKPSNASTAGSSPRPLTLIRSMLGLEQCLCAEPPFPTMFSSPTQFVELIGVQYIGLGAVTDELTPYQRIQDSVEQLSTNTERTVTIGYVVEDVQADDDDDDDIVLRQPKSTEKIPLQVWKETYPNDKNMSRSVRRIIDDIKSKDYSSAMEFLSAERNENQKRPNRNNGRYLEGISAHNLGVVSVLDGGSKLAIEYFHQAVELKANAFGSEHVEVALSLNELGIQLFAQNRIDEAQSSFLRARSICQRRQSNGPARKLVPALLNNLACCYFLLNPANRMSALLSVQEARDLQQSADVDLLHVATTVSNHGYLALRVKQYEQASGYFQEALLIQQSVLGDGHDLRAIRDTQSNLETSNAFHC